jgi:hypothetical protein
VLTGSPLAAVRANREQGEESKRTTCQIGMFVTLSPAGMPPSRFVEPHDGVPADLPFELRGVPAAMARSWSMTVMPSPSVLAHSTPFRYYHHLNGESI